MNPTQSEESNARDAQCQSAEAHLAATKLNVHEFESLAYTEMPAVNPPPPAVSTRITALLKAMYYWVDSRL